MAQCLVSFLIGILFSWNAMAVIPAHNDSVSAQTAVENAQQEEGRVVEILSEETENLLLESCASGSNSVSADLCASLQYSADADVEAGEDEALLHEAGYRHNGRRPNYHHRHGRRPHHNYGPRRHYYNGRRYRHIPRRHYSYLTRRAIYCETLSGISCFTRNYTRNAFGVLICRCF